MNMHGRVALLFWYMARWAAQASKQHTTDADCRPHLDEEGLSCTVCGVSWSDGCESCGGHAFHKDGCPEVER